MFLYFQKGHWWLSYYDETGHKILSRQSSGAFAEVERELAKIVEQQMGWDPFEKFVSWKGMVYYTLEHFSENDRIETSKFYDANVLTLANQFPRRRFSNVTKKEILERLDRLASLEEGFDREPYLAFLTKMYDLALERWMVKENPF
jgi:hypothetical protein